MTEGIILYRREENACLIKLVGCLRFTISSRFEAFIRQMFVENAPERVTIDMTETEHIDSTILGLLARIARYLRAHSDRRPIINTDHEDMVLLLETMGFDQVFTIRSQPPEPSESLVEIPGGEGGAAADARTVLDAHETLMRMNAKNRDRFLDVVEMMEQEVASERDKDVDKHAGPTDVGPSGDTR